MSAELEAAQPDPPGRDVREADGQLHPHILSGGRATHNGEIGEQLGDGDRIRRGVP
jgi:hypothetical protein